MAQAAQASLTDPAQGALPKARVLIVEDSPVLNRVLCDILGHEYETLSAEDGRRGLELAKKERPDLILTDLVMPRMPGEAMIAALRSRSDFASVPIVVLTAMEDSGLRVRLLRSGVQDFIPKPFLTEEVRARVRNLVDAKRARDLLEAALEAQSETLESLALELVDKKKALERALEASRRARVQAEEANLAKGNFLRMMSHELRTPVTAMAVQVCLMRSETSNAVHPRIREGIEALGRSLSWLTELMDTVLEYERLDAGVMRLKCSVFSAIDLCNEVMAFLRPHAEQKGLEFRLRVEEGQRLPMHTDRHILRLILVNLIGNAVKYTPRGHVCVRLAARGEAVEFLVEDTGPGIPRAKHQEVFEAFRRIEHLEGESGPGSGLGLAIVKDLVAALGGEIVLKSDGHGACFRVMLPRQPPAASRCAEDQSAGTGATSEGSQSYVASKAAWS